MEASVRILGRAATRGKIPITRLRFEHEVRAFSTTPFRLQDADTFPSTVPSSRSTVSPKISTILDESLDLDKGAYSTRQSRGVNRQPAPSNSNSSISAFARTMTAGARSKNHASSQSPNSALDFDTMFGASSSSGPPSGISSEDVLPSVKLDPTVGRTVKVDMNRGMDVGKAFRMLEMSCARNRVRQDFMRQRFHERPGLKRKRLKGERWRRNFKKGFKEVVGMVVRMKRQGW